MKNRIISKALCIALASALVFGEAAPVKAAADTDGQAQAVTASSTEAARIDYFSAGSSSVIEDSRYLYISAEGYGDRAKLYINDVLYDTADSYSDGSWYMYNSFQGKAGVVYTIKLVAEDVFGATVTKTVKRKFAAYGFDKSGCYTSMYYNDDDGYSKYNGVEIHARLKGSINGDVGFDIYRSTNPKSGFKKIGSKDDYYTSSMWYDDDTISFGKTYYYKVKLVARKDTYNKSEKVLTVSPVMKVVPKTELGSIYYSAKLGDKGVDISIDSPSVYNQFDIYRSSRKNGGYSKIKTTTSKEYTDKTVKEGKSYFYKIVPKYYDPVSNKLISGPVAANGYGVKVLMGNPAQAGYDDALKITKLSTSSVKLSWGKVCGANLYEIWYMNSSISGDKYTKLGSTKGTSYTVKGLRAGDEYAFRLKAQKVSGGKVLYENYSYNEYATMKYDGEIRNVRSAPVRTALSKDKKTYVIYTDIAWDKTMGASGYVIYAYNNFTGKREKITKLPASKNRIRFRNPGSRTAGMKYSSITIQAYKGSAISDSSSSASVNRIPYAKGVKVARKTNGTAVVRWSAVPGATSYIVRRVNRQTGSTSWRAEVSGTSFVDNNFSVKTGYMYYIQPNMAFSGVEVVSIDDYMDKKGYTFIYEHKLGAPKMASAKNTAAKTVTVSWNKVTGAQAYYVYRATSKTGKYVKVGAVKGTSFVDKKAAKGKTYYYKAASIAYGGNGIKAQSKYSAAVGVKCTK